MRCRLRNELVTLSITKNNPQPMYNLRMRLILVSVLMGFSLTSCSIFARKPPVLILTPVALESPAVTPTPSNITCSTITLVISDGANSEIYTVCPDGSQLTNLTGDKASDTDPAWSPDGSRIAFTSDRDGSKQVYVMDADGKYPMELTSDYVNDKPIWLPDGERIAFRTYDGTDQWWWRIIDLTSYEIIELSAPSYDAFFQTPAWSPDGSQLAYMSLIEQQERNDGSSQLHVKVLPNRSDVALTGDVWANINPVWSPDGARIAFFSERDGTYNLFALYVINVDGSGLQRVTPPLYTAKASVSWSPDGKWVVVGGNVYPINDVQIINLASKEALNFLDLPAGSWASEPDWQPDK